MNNNQQETGFTLIELMIVTAIIGILAAIAIPGYQTYITKAQISEAVTLSGGLKVHIAEYLAFDGSLSNADSGAGTIPAAAPNGAGLYVDALEVIDGAIVATFKATDVAAAIQGKTLRWNPTLTGSELSWACTSSGANRIEQRFLPKGCTSS